MSSVAPVAPTSRWSRVWGALTRQDKRSLAGMVGFIVLLHVVGFGVLLTVVVPRHFDLGTTGAFGIGVGVLAYTLGMRHAFDADHIAAVDNTTRKLMADGFRRPLSVGFWFSLGHSRTNRSTCRSSSFLRTRPKTATSPTRLRRMGVVDRVRDHPADGEHDVLTLRLRPVQPGQPRVDLVTQHTEIARVRGASAPEHLT